MAVEGTANREGALSKPGTRNSEPGQGTFQPARPACYLRADAGTGQATPDQITARPAPPSRVTGADFSVGCPTAAAAPGPGEAARRISLREHDIRAHGGPNREPRFGRDRRGGKRRSHLCRHPPAGPEDHLRSRYGPGRGVRSARTDPGQQLAESGTGGHPGQSRDRGPVRGLRIHRCRAVREGQEVDPDRPPNLSRRGRLPDLVRRLGPEMELQNPEGIHQPRQHGPAAQHSVQNQESPPDLLSLPDLSHGKKGTLERFPVAVDRGLQHQGAPTDQPLLSGSGQERRRAVRPGLLLETGLRQQLYLPGPAQPSRAAWI